MITTSTILAGLAALAAAKPILSRDTTGTSSSLPATATKGFTNSSIVQSQGGHGLCVEGTIPVTASNMAVKLNLPTNMTNDELTQLVLSSTYANATIAGQIVGSQPQFQNVTGTFDISAQLCFPASGPSQNSSSIQFLTHGAGFGGSYWDFAPNASYADNAAQAGQITFSYDRLGIGNSSHPDPINIVQAGIHVQIAHTLVQMLRDGALADIKFNSVVGVGHSFGSAVTLNVANDFPKDFDAVILTGFSTNSTNSDQFTASENNLAASVAAPARFADLPQGYIVASTRYGVQYSFFTYPDFATDVLDQAFNNVQTTTLGEMFSGGSFTGVAANFTGPAYIVDGDHDIAYCDGNCMYPSNIPEQSLKPTFPKAAKGSGSYILPNAGHALNLHLNANTAFDNMQQWIKGVGF